MNTKNEIIIKPVSCLKSKLKKAWSVSYLEIEKLNYFVAKKLVQNKQEEIASIIEANNCIIN